jgi:hypothetical protein
LATGSLLLAVSMMDADQPAFTEALQVEYAHYTALQCTRAMRKTPQRARC